MANAIAENVIRVDTDAQFDGIYKIRYIKCVGGSCTIKANNSSGQTIYEGASGAADQVHIHTNGMYVDVSSATIYIYLALD